MSASGQQEPTASTADASDVADITHFLERYYAAMETNDPLQYGAFYTPDISLVFGNADPILGKQAVVDAFDAALSRVRSLHHDLVNVWSVSGGTVVFESLGTWHLRNGESVTIPACSVFRVREARLADLRIYVDNAPVDAALERTPR